MQPYTLSCDLEVKTLDSPSILRRRNPLQPGVAGFLLFSGGLDKQHRAVMG